MATLEQILEKEKKSRHEGGDFGITACKECIKFNVKYAKTDLYQLLKEFVDRANNDPFFNRAMVLACWELINER